MSPKRHIYYDIVALLTMFPCPRPTLPITRLELTFMTESHECIKIRVRTHDHAATIPTIATIRSASWNMLLPPAMYRPISTITTTNTDNYMIYHLSIL